MTPSHDHAAEKLEQREAGLTESQRLAQVETALRDSEERYRELFENSRDAIYIHDLNGRYTSVNRAAEKLTGYSREEILGRHYSNFVRPTYLKTVRENFCRKLDVPLETTYETEIACKDGTRKPVEVTSRMIYRNGEPVGVQGTVRDISERKRAQRALQTYSRRLVNAQEAERENIVRELHDNIGQYLSALLLGLESCARLPQLPAAAVDQLSYLKETTKQLELDVHGVALELRPTTLDDLGLEAALSSLTREWARRHDERIRAVFNSTGFTKPAERLSSDVEVAIYRVAQEALTNVSRHSKAAVVSVILARDDRNVQVIIEDDGVGFDVENLMSDPIEDRRLGLVGMQERVQLVGGEFKIESGAGTTIVVTIPLQKAYAAG